MKDAEYYKRISAKGKEVMWRKKSKGELMHLAPLGYKNVHIKGRSLKMIDLETWLLVEEARQLRREGKSIRQICQIMANRGLLSSREKMVGPSSMLNLLKV